MSDAIPRDVPFTLSCSECDRDSPDSYDEAIADGWTHIVYFPQGCSENFLGLCPACRQEEERTEALLRQSFASPDDTEHDSGSP